MDKKRLDKLRRQLARLRNRVANIRSDELIRFAEALGRRQSKRGKEPTFISELLPYSKPISIPNHPGNLKKYTAGNILDALEQDILSLEENIKN